MPQTTSDWITVVIAVWGAVLFTLVAIDRLRRNRRQVQIDASFSKTSDKFRVSVANIGRQPLKIVAVFCFVDVGYGEEVMGFSLGDYDPGVLPRTLAGGQDIDIVVEWEQLRTLASKERQVSPHLRPTRIVVMDSTGQSHFAVLSNELKMGHTTQL